MPFVDKIKSTKSVAIVGLEKNTGKTVCLNYVLGRLSAMGVRCAVTSIGVDGEQVDSVYATAKPEVTLYGGTVYVTSERHYARRRLISSILDVGEQRTALGRLVTAEVLQQGKALISGPATTETLARLVDHLHGMVDGPVIVDGALSRLSLASPTVTQSMVLATGAAVSPNIRQLVEKTRFAYRLIALDEVGEDLRGVLTGVCGGLWAVDADNGLHDLGVASAFLLSAMGGELFRYGDTFFAAGAVTDRLLKSLSSSGRKSVLVVRDFTKLFITREVFYNYTSHGGIIKVLKRSNLLAITLNPTSPQGFRLNSDEACDALSQALGLPVYDVVKRG